jgi:mRNA interferase MazF
MARYIPKQGDFIILNFDPPSGHEQKGRRPALVISKTAFNRHTGMVMLCPITNTFRNFPFHVAVPENAKLTGYIMVEQIKSVDYASRKARYLGKAPRAVVNQVLGILDACIYDAG